MAAGFTINGSSRLASTLRRAGVEMKELKPVNREAAEIAMEQARLLAPVRSGRLRDTIRVGATNRAGIVRAGNNRATGVPYAGPVHWGWPRGGERLAADIKPNPFMLLAARQTEPRWRARYEAFTSRILRTVKGA